MDPIVERCTAVMREMAAVKKTCPDVILLTPPVAAAIRRHFHADRPTPALVDVYTDAPPTEHVAPNAHA